RTDAKGLRSSNRICRFVSAVCELVMDLSFFADSPLPNLDGMYWVKLASRVAHTSFGAILLGGMVYLRLMFAHSAESSPSNALICFNDRRALWARCVALATVVLL